MKACIITVYNSENCGSYWQSVAMQEYLKSCGYEVAFLKRNMKGASHTFYSAIKRSVRYCLQRRFYMIPAVIRQYYAFHKATSTFMISDQCDESYDLCVLGSDTIWNLDDIRFRNNRTVYWGNTSRARKTISYAASLANTTGSSIEKYKETIRGLNSLYAVGVRDEHSRKVLEQYSVKPVKVVCDPTLLLDKEFYISKANPVRSNNYIFVYYFQKMPEDLSKALFAFAKKNGLSVVVMSNTTNIKGDLQLNYYSPHEFLNYFANAAYVVTNTFHGTIFTVLFEKQAVFNSDNKKKVRDLLERFGTSHRDYYMSDNADSLFQNGQINYEEVRKKVDEFRTESVGFLQDAITGLPSEQGILTGLPVETLKNADLSRKTTFRIGGTAENFYIPSSSEELRQLIRTLNIRQEKFFVLSGGSNLLINDKKTFRHVICMEKAALELIDFEEGRFYIGASNRIQQVIRFVNERGYGGFEELIGLPALFGGVIYMNAGIGGRRKPLFNIGDYITRVKAFDRHTGDLIWLGHDQCAFDYRSSVFQNDQYVILGAELRLEPQNIDESDRRIRARKEYCKANQIWAKGCFGTCFSQSERKVLKLFAAFGIHKGGIKQAANNSNWLINDGSGTYDDAVWLIERITKAHRLLRRPIELEVRIWK